ncbi:MAG: hypothetical protein MH321_07055 [Leptospiraceae bacterium]|nr:hypothetical protein [Leptospiraceae bacterium]
MDELLIYNRPHLYVEGNPVGFRDESGNNTVIGQLNTIMKHMIGGIKIATKTARSLGRGLDHSMRKAGRGIDGAARQLASGGKYSRNKGNDLDHLLGTRRTFAGIENSNLGDKLDKIFRIDVILVTIYFSVFLAGIVAIILGGELILSGIFLFGIPLFILGLALTGASACRIMKSLEELQKLPNPQLQ